MNYLDEFYNTIDEEKRLLSRHGRVEYLTTMKYIKECLEGAAHPIIRWISSGKNRPTDCILLKGSL